MNRAEATTLDGAAGRARKVSAVSRNRAIRTLNAANQRAGVETPVPGDQIAILGASYTTVIAGRGYLWLR
ncbi:UDP-N-acetylmuramoyl-L-alanyl-D-glutamate--2,6-diaminopimelate ligase [Mycolicibacterium fortuitum subsp. acetamidolyticum]|uniref:UDP-N-acetylmuramoyl-L-alanyl-D-glutamate--2,6-diaminopimelate ligase n=1 Tax=Mycolicibacterium fortuitum subsp. acetamidolyticum TaxID=144550 RepID=A0A100WMJ9_MYCFO|nr:UDP-N-acetylmuramoyl-L-alanyl-D-glutamate--2,6-diaminopimelate ligase [Mycolicibacterium fortuitum subsp. acetamidolyticum]